MLLLLYILYTLLLFRREPEASALLRSYPAAPLLLRASSFAVLFAQDDPKIARPDFDLSWSCNSCVYLLSCVCPLASEYFNFLDKFAQSRVVEAFFYYFNSGNLIDARKSA